MIELDEYQMGALSKMHNGCILRGDVGSGKTRTSLAYYYISVCGGGLKINKEGSTKKMKTPRDLYVITTAKNRDDGSWFKELAKFGIYEHKEYNPSNVSVTVDSWNNIKKYTNIFGAFFIFDEQRLVGTGAWVKAFYKIAQKNQWILLTATPGDEWKDYMPVFIANGFYRNKSEFNSKHIVFSPYCKNFPKIEKYIGIKQLMQNQQKILVNMVDKRTAVEHHVNVFCDYDWQKYRTVQRDRWDPYENEPIAETGKLCYLERRVVNSDISRINELTKLLESNKTAIIFYNFDYELEIICDLLTKMAIPFTQWNGHKHETILNGDNWAYVVQYSAGCEAWNCITTNVIIFYSQNYSYKVMIQAAGRINRRNTLFTDLYYYHLRSHAPIDMAIRRALSLKRNFNEKSYIGKQQK